MSRRSRQTVTLTSSDRVHARLFAALGDRTRLRLISKLVSGQPVSITGLAEGFALSRQAVTKHLRVLEGAGLLRRARAGRETRFHLTPEPIERARDYLDEVARQWGEALGRLKEFVESDAVES